MLNKSTTIPLPQQEYPPQTCKRTIYTWYYPRKISKTLKGNSNCHIKIFRFSISIGKPFISDCIQLFCSINSFEHCNQLLFNQNQSYWQIRSYWEMWFIMAVFFLSMLLISFGCRCTFKRKATNFYKLLRSLK